MDDRSRFVVAVILMLGVIIVPSLLIRRPPPPNPDRTPAITDSAGAPAPESLDDVPEFQEPQPVPQPTPSAVAGPAGTAAAGAEDTVVVESELYRFAFSSRGARLISASPMAYRSLAPQDQGAPAQIIPEQSEFLASALLFGNDTVSMGGWRFEPSTRHLQVDAEHTTLTWLATRGSATIRLEYRFRPDNYLFDVHGTLEGLQSENPLVLVAIGPGLRSVEADSVTDQRTFGVVTKDRKTRNHKFKSFKPDRPFDLEGPFEWIAVKSKYFLAGVLTIQEGQPRIGGAVAIGEPKTGRVETRVHVTASLPVNEGVFDYSVYVGPQEYRRFAAIGHDLEDANPYGWILRPIIRPVSIVIVNLLLWGHENLHVAYGWLLVMFGIAVRVLLWPLNQKAMRSQRRMQAIQPQIEAVRKRHEGDQRKIGEETQKLFREHKVNPLGGCLPLMLPMPILFAFFFVFLNTIELRGVPFLWLPDLSAKDPLYLIPIMMGLSMFLVSKIGQRGMPANPQQKMMTYIMPIFLTVLFVNFASGLNLYYASQNLASLPQQWLIARERSRTTD